MFKMRLETERLILREFIMDDLDELYVILSDPKSMEYYPAPFTYEKCRWWIQWNLDNYKKYGFGLWAVTLKEDGKFMAIVFNDAEDRRQSRTGDWISYQ